MAKMLLPAKATLLRWSVYHLQGTPVLDTIRPLPKTNRAFSSPKRAASDVEKF